MRRFEIGFSRYALRYSRGARVRLENLSTTNLAFLSELEKIAEYAPGLPSKKKMTDVRKVEKPQNWHLVVQHHPAVRAGDHHDIRIIDPVTRIAHSWATKKDFPKPGDKPIRVYQQPDHTERYSREFSGHITKGYGRTKAKSKGVQKVEDERLEVLQADKNMVRFNFYKGKGPEEFVLVKNKKSGGPAPTWTLLNVTKTKERLPPDLPFNKPKYKEVAPEAIDFSDAKQVMSAKLDGGHNTFLLQPGQRPRIFSYREPKERKTGAIEHSHKVSDLYLRRVPKSVGETILRGELYGVGESGPLPGEVVGGMLNANVWRSRELQRRHGALRPAVFDVVKYKGKSLERAGYREKLKALEEIRKELPEFEIPDMAFTAEEKKALLNAIKEKKHPKTHEGVILWHADEPKPPIKSKFTVDHDVYVRDVFPVIDSRTGKPRDEAGGFSYSLTPNGPIVGKVGTGFSSALRGDLFRRTNLYRGAVAKIVAEKQTASGALAKPRFAGWHVDKQHERFWDKEPVVK